MMKAGMKKREIAVRAAKVKAVQSQGEELRIFFSARNGVCDGEDVFIAFEMESPEILVGEWYGKGSGRGNSTKQ
jgi:hypothetical protein